MSTSRTWITPMLALTGCLGALVLLATPAWSEAGGASSLPVVVEPEGDTDHRRPKHGSLGNIGAKLSDPTSDIWALQFNFNAPTFSDGDLNTGDPKVGGNVIFQPVLPFPLYGTGTKEWKMITRPVIPIIFGQSVQKDPLAPAVDNFKSVGGIGDIELPLVFTLPTAFSGHWLLGAGPAFEFPSSTNDALGAQQYSVGPAVVAGYKNKHFTAVVFPNYYFGVGDRGDRKASTPTTSKLSMLYALYVNLPNAWQVGFNPTISYNNNESSGNKWNFPVGLLAAKTVKLGKVPTKIEFAVEYSIVSQDDFGKRANFRLVVTPVIPGLIKSPIFGGD